MIWDYGLCIINLAEMFGKSRLFHGLMVLLMRVALPKVIRVEHIINCADNFIQRFNTEQTTATSSSSPQQPKRAPNKATSLRKQGSRR